MFQPDQNCTQSASPVQQEISEDALVCKRLLRELLDEVDPEVELLEQGAPGEVRQHADLVASQPPGVFWKDDFSNGKTGANHQVHWFFGWVDWANKQTVMMTLYFF